MNNKSTNYFIAGLGLAGAIMAIRLHQEGKSFMVWDDDSENAASKAAAGLFNPISGRNMVKTWKADLLFPELMDFYSNAEILLDRKFFYPRSIYRPFISTMEQNEWMGRSSNDHYIPFIKEVLTQPMGLPYFKDPYGGLLLKMSGNVVVKEFLSGVRDWLKVQGLMIHGKLPPEKLNLVENGVIFEGGRADHVIFCEGLGAMKNPFFKDLPFRPVKGEGFDIACEVDMDLIYNRGIFVIPISNNKFKIGATYDNHNLEPGNTKKGEKELLDKLYQIWNEPVTIESGWYGVRPATKDRRPMLGCSQESDRVWMLNGFGAKGVSLAPYYSKHLLEVIEHKKELESAVNYNRFFS